MARKSANDNQADQRIFLSYSRVDRARVNGLGNLLEALGHRVFIDHKTIMPGRKWRAELQQGLDEADVLLVFWTRHSAKSTWVRNEYEYFNGKYPDRKVVPILGDKTELSELLKQVQAADLFPLLNELFELKEKLEREGIPAAEIDKAIVKRLAEAGIELDRERERTVLKLFPARGLRSLKENPASKLRTVGGAIAQAASQATLPQISTLIGAAAAGFLVCVGSHMLSGPGEKAVSLPPVLKAPSASDQDGDGLSDEEERRLGTLPDKPDTDGDLLPDGFEVAGGLNPLLKDDSNADPDGDGLSNLDENINRTLPNDRDTDGDGVPDGTEVEQGSSPTDPSDSSPPEKEETVQLRLTVGDHSGSKSERYNLIVGPYTHQAPEFGVVNTKVYSFRRGQSYEIRLVHVATKESGQPDYDYTANITGRPNTYIIDDPKKLLGKHLDRNDFAGKTARLVIP